MWMLIKVEHHWKECWESVDKATIIFIIFRDFLVFYQIFLSPQVKRWTNITYKHGIYVVHHELPNNLGLRAPFTVPCCQLLKAAIPKTPNDDAPAPNPPPAESKKCPPRRPPANDNRNKRVPARSLCFIGFEAINFYVFREMSCFGSNLFF